MNKTQNPNAFIVSKTTHRKPEWLHMESGTREELPPLLLEVNQPIKTPPFFVSLDLQILPRNPGKTGEISPNPWKRKWVFFHLPSFFFLIISGWKGKLDDFFFWAICCCLLLQRQGREWRNWCRGLVGKRDLGVWSGCSLAEAGRAKAFSKPQPIDYWPFGSNIQAIF